LFDDTLASANSARSPLIPTPETPFGIDADQTSFNLALNRKYRPQDSRADAPIFGQIGLVFLSLFASFSS
jgi:hypothetical protein